MLVASTEMEISSFDEHGEGIRDLCRHIPSQHVVAGMLNTPHVLPELKSEYVML